MLKSLETEKNLYEMRQILPLEHDVFEKESKDIVEHWNENKLDEWRGRNYVYRILLKTFSYYLGY